MASPQRQPWTAEVKFTQEDEAIKLLVDEFGDRNWSALVAKLRNSFGIKGR